MTPQKKFIGHEPSPDPLQQRRHPSLPPFMRSFSQHATVIRRVISRSRSRGTTMTESPVTDTDEKVLKVVGAGTGGTSGSGAGGGGENRVDSSKGKGKILRPALAHRITSGSADQEVSSSLAFERLLNLLQHATQIHPRIRTKGWVQKRPHRPMLERSRVRTHLLMDSELQEGRKSLERLLQRRSLGV
ncbi:hypothetical protein FRC20_011052 [Serendipita sp. 405]|nr:hypothetical protein FRC20_011052 [Serendipita sp. 405]